MYLNIPSQGGSEGVSAPKTPEILNSLFSLAIPPLPDETQCKEEAPHDLLSPASSTYGDDGRGWVPVGGDAYVPHFEQCARIPQHPPPSSTPHTTWTHQLPSLSSTLLTPTSDGNPNSPDNLIPYHPTNSLNSPTEMNANFPKIILENDFEGNILSPYDVGSLPFPIVSLNNASPSHNDANGQTTVILSENQSPIDGQTFAAGTLSANQSPIDGQTFTAGIHPANQSPLDDQTFASGNHPANQSPLDGQTFAADPLSANHSHLDGQNCAAGLPSANQSPLYSQTCAIGMLSANQSPLDDQTCAGMNPPELTSPVSTVEATRMALVKEGLKLTITSKLQQVNPFNANNSNFAQQFFSEDPFVTNCELTPDDEERRYRRRERNKVAATKCRNKKKEMAAVLISESSVVEDLNIRLKNEVERLTQEKERLERSLSDITHRSSCKHVPSVVKPASSLSDFQHLKSPSAHIAKEQPASPFRHFKSPSAPIAKDQPASPNPTSYVLSPCDSKDFIIDTTNCFSEALPNMLPVTVCKIEEKASDLGNYFSDLDSSNSNINTHKTQFNSCRYQPYVSSPLNARRNVPQILDIRNNPAPKLGTNLEGTLSDYERNLSFIEKINPFTYPSNSSQNSTDGFSECQNLDLASNNSLNYCLTSSYDLQNAIPGPKKLLKPKISPGKNINSIISYTNL